MLGVVAFVTATWSSVALSPCLAGSYEAIHQAAATGDDDVLYELIRDDPPSVNAKDESDNTPLHLAAQNLQTDTVLRLLNAAADYDTKNSDGFTPLHLAILHGDNDEDGVKRRVKVVTILLMQGASVTEHDGRGRLPVHIAAIKGRLGAMNVLARAGASFTAADATGREPIHFAALHGRVGLINSLVTHKIDVSVRDRAGLTPLHYAARGTRIDTVKRLLQLGASASNVTQAGRTALHLTADAKFDAAEREKRAIGIADLLIENGVDVGAQDKSGKTAADLATAREHTRLAKRLR